MNYKEYLYSMHGWQVKKTKSIWHFISIGGTHLFMYGRDSRILYNSFDHYISGLEKEVASIPYAFCMSYFLNTLREEYSVNYEL